MRLYCPEKSLDAHEANNPVVATVLGHSVGDTGSDCQALPQD